MPTASSAQTSKKIPKMKAKSPNRISGVFAFRHTHSPVIPVPKSRNPITRKSENVQETSVVNCMAINGIDNRRKQVIRMAKIRLAEFIIFFLRNNYFIVNLFETFNVFCEAYHQSCYFHFKFFNSFRPGHKNSRIGTDCITFHSSPSEEFSSRNRKTVLGEFLRNRPSKMEAPM